MKADQQTIDNNKRIQLAQLKMIKCNALSRDNCMYSKY